MGNKKKPTKKRQDATNILVNALVDLLVGLVLIIIGKMID